MDPTSKTDKTLEQVVSKAISVFDHPHCDSMQDCHPVDFTDVFQSVDRSDSKTPAHSPEQMRHLSLGLFWMLEALGYTRQVGHQDGGTLLSDATQKNLTQYYFSNIIKEMRAAGVWGTAYSRLSWLKGALQTGNVRETEVAALAIENTILGFTVYLHDTLHIDLDWDQVQRNTGMTQPTAPTAEATPPSLPVEAKPPAPPPPPPKRAGKKPPEHHKKEDAQAEPLESKAPPPRIKMSRSKAAQEYIAKLEQLTKVTGGILQGDAPDLGTSMAEKILERIPIKIPKKYYQIEVLIDASGSMKDNVEDVKKNMVKIYSLAEKQLQAGGQVSIGLRYYVDDITGDWGRVVRLDSRNTMDMHSHGDTAWWENFVNPWKRSNVEAVRTGLQKIFDKIGDGSLEFHWEASMSALKGEPWATENDVEKVLFLLTDEDEDGGANVKEYSLQQVIDTATAKGVRFEVILYTDLDLDGCFLGDTLLKTETGSITFAELNEKEERGEPLPAIGALDSQTGETRYQIPREVIRKIGHQSWLEFALTGQSGDSTIRVTQTHRMLVQKEGQSVWVKAMEMQPGDLLINPSGKISELKSIRHIEDDAPYYNISFGITKANGLKDAYLVSSDGKEWFAAHSRR
ncbi:MAG: hypothetical protein Q7T03_10535 [Deltaproteobacteria bacterium]|nr:hypothetical protein [Deltaproteobacteria bacterium]